MSQERLGDLLKRLGLDSMEATIYAALERAGVSTGPEVCARTKIPPSKAYGVLRSLESLGIVSTVHGRPMRFIAEPVDRALTRLVDRRRRELSEIGTEARLMAAKERTKGERITGYLRSADDAEIRDVCREIASSRFQSKIVLTSEGEKILRDAGSRQRIDLLGLLRAEWKTREIQGQISTVPYGTVSYAVVDRSTVHLFLRGHDREAIIVTLNSLSLAETFLSLDADKRI
jgi:hypothetical protein